MTRRHADTQTRRHAGRNVVIFNKEFSLMHRLALSLFFCALILTVGAQPSYAEDTASNSKAEIVVDDDSGTVSILINGKIAVLIDETGLHVKENIEYGGTISDMGRENAIPVKDNKETDDEE